MRGDKRVVGLSENSNADFANNADNSLCGLTIPKLGRTGRLPIAVHDTAECIENACLVRANHNVGPICDSDGPLRVVSECQARYAENGGFFLKPAGVCEHNCGGRFQVQEFEIAER